MRSNRREQAAIAKGQAQADEWNAKYPIGTVVDVRRNEGPVTRTKTRSVAWILGHGAPVVLVDGISGGYGLDWITVVQDAEASTP